MATIHASAIVDSNAQLADDVVIGPYAVIGAHVTMGSGCIVGSHSVVEGHTTLGKENRIGHFADARNPALQKIQTQKRTMKSRITRNGMIIRIERFSRAFKANYNYMKIANLFSME